MITRIRSFLVVAVLAAVVAASASAGPPVSPVLAQVPDTSTVVPDAVLTALSEPDHPVTQALAGVMLSPATATVEVLSDFTLDILVDCGTHAEVAEARVTFDPTYMQVVTVTTDASVFPTVAYNVFDNVSGSVIYDAGSLTCHSQGSCPAGVIRMATITFRAIARSFPSKYVGINGEVLWSGSVIFDGQGSGSTITITSPVSPVYLPFVSRGWAF
jgi:hypothetical protein